MSYIPSGTFGKGLPTHDLIMDPGHMIFLPRRKIAVPAESLLKVYPSIYTKKWTELKESSLRYDLVLTSPAASYLANGVRVMSRKSLFTAGYSHSYGHMI